MSLSLSSCSKIWISGAQRQSLASNSAASADPKEVYFHKVRPGETLSALSRKYLGHSGRWKELLLSNPGLRADHLRPGQEIVLPDAALEYLAQKQNVSVPRFSLANGKANSKSQKLASTQSQRSALPKAAAAKASAAKLASKAKAPTVDIAERAIAKAPKRTAPEEEALVASIEPETTQLPEVVEKPAPAPVAAKPRIDLVDEAPPLVIERKAPVRNELAAVVNGDSGLKRESLPSIQRPSKLAAENKSLAKLDKSTSSENRGSTIQRTKTRSKPSPSMLSNPEDQLSRSMFYSCSAEKCSLHKYE